MNLIISSHPKDLNTSIGGVLAMALAGRLGGQSQTLQLYGADQHYFRFEFNEEWIKLVEEADNLIFPVPMWNFSIPAALKDFFDKIAKRGRLWDLGKDKNFVGLLKNKKAYIIMTAGGGYPSGASEDFVVPYLKTVLKFIGVENTKDFRVLNITKSEKLLADKAYIEDQTCRMLKAFSL